jgi:hypothetical protein
MKLPPWMYIRPGEVPEIPRGVYERRPMGPPGPSIVLSATAPIGLLPPTRRAEATKFRRALAMGRDSTGGPSRFWSRRIMCISTSRVLPSMTIGGPARRLSTARGSRKMLRATAARASTTACLVRDMA